MVDHDCGATLFEPLSGDEFRPIHYIGNKSRHLDAIEAVIDSLTQPGVAACDLFAGTAVVTRRLTNKRPVVTADVQAYSQVLARALTRPTVVLGDDLSRLVSYARRWLESVYPAFAELLDLERRALSAAPTDSAPLASLIEHGSFEMVDGDHDADFVRAKHRARTVAHPEASTLTWYYGGVYFSYAQALELDALRHAVRRAYGDVRDDTAVAAIMSVASDAVSTVGSHFAQPVQPRARSGHLKQGWIAPVTRRRQYSVLDGFARWLSRYGFLRPAPHHCIPIRSDFRHTLRDLNSEVGVIYADPPYTRDHYSRFYHVLETIALDDIPGVTTSPSSHRPSRGLYRVERHQSHFSIRSKVRPAFKSLFEETQRLDVPLVLSYSPMSEGTRARTETRMISIDDLVTLARRYFRDVETLEINSSTHSRFNRTQVNAHVGGNAELLLVARND